MQFVQLNSMVSEEKI